MGRTRKYKSSKKSNRKFRPKECTDAMTFQECELAILRQVVDENEKIAGEKLASSAEIKKMIQIVEDFLEKKKLICYGGTAINNILPKEVQFYNKDYQIPDYDFFSPNAMEDAKELADIFFKEGYEDVEAKSGVHEGTYKVYVNFIPMADVTQLHKELFNILQKEAVKVAGIYYAPPNYLRMGMYLELSRPAGDISRWEKVLKRLNLLNEYHPMKLNRDCPAIDFQRRMDKHEEDHEAIYYIIRDTFVDLGLVFFGGYASTLYAKYMPKQGKRFVQKIPDFDVLSENPERSATIVKERLEDAGFKKISIVHHKAYGEIIPEHYEVKMGNDILAFIYKPTACHNYNTITVDGRDINVATIDTIMSFYLAFLFSDADYYFKDRILCMGQYLFEVERKTRLAQKGLLKRFVPKCIGVQETMESIRAKKAARFTELKKKRGTREFEEVFLRYAPGEKKMILEKQDKKIEKTLKDEEKTLDSISKDLKKERKTKKQRKTPNLLKNMLFPL
jgi:hypothetical protein